MRHSYVGWYALSEDYRWSTCWLRNASIRDYVWGPGHRNLMKSGQRCSKTLRNPGSSGSRGRLVSTMFGWIIRSGYRKQRFRWNPCRILVDFSGKHTVFWSNSVLVPIVCGRIRRLDRVPWAMVYDIYVSFPFELFSFRCPAHLCFELEDKNILMERIIQNKKLFS